MQSPTGLHPKGVSASERKAVSSCLDTGECLQHPACKDSKQQAKAAVLLAVATREEADCGSRSKGSR